MEMTPEKEREEQLNKMKVCSYISEEEAVVGYHADICFSGMR
jgi:hypothetical protein